MTLAITPALVSLTLMLFATALHLRRIANILSDINSKIPHKLNNVEVFNTVEQLAWSAGRSFEQGRRTDR